MIDINLLPWRQQQRDRRERIFKRCLILTVIIAIAIVLIIHNVLNARLRQLQHKNKLLSANVKQLVATNAQLNIDKISYQRLIDKMNHLNLLHNQATQTVHLFEVVTDSVPKGLFLEKFSRKGEQIFLAGHANVNATVTLFLNHLVQSHLFKNAELTRLSADEHSNDLGQYFEITLGQHLEAK